MAELPNATVCDVRRFVTSADDLLSDIRHYRRHVYLQMAEEIRAAGVAGLTIERQRWTTLAFAAVWGFAGRRKVEARRWWRRVRGLPPPRCS